MGLSVNCLTNNVVFRRYILSWEPRITRRENHTPGTKPPAVAQGITTSAWVRQEVFVVGSSFAPIKPAPIGRLYSYPLEGGHRKISVISMLKISDARKNPK